MKSLYTASLKFQTWNGPCTKVGDTEKERRMIQADVQRGLSR